MAFKTSIELDDNIQQKLDAYLALHSHESLENILENEDWLHQSPLKENLDQALEWNANHPPKFSDLEALEIKLDNYE